MITKPTILKIRIWTGSIALSLLCSMFPGTEVFSAEWTHTYDVMDRLQGRTDPLGRTESYIYDLAGNLLRSTDRKGQVTTFTYDALNRVSRVDYADGSSTTFLCDSVGRLSGIADSISGTIAFEFNNLDRLVRETSILGTVQYSYDAIGRRTSMIVAGQVPVTYTYDAASRLTQITQGNQTVVIGYDAAGRRTALVYPNGTVTTYAYDNASRLTTIVHALGTSQVESLSYTYDAAGNRVTAVRGNGPAVSLPPPTQAAYDASNQQTKFNSGTPNLTYDANGNLLSKADTSGTTTYTWDARNRLTAINGPGTSAAFSYDALNRRISKTINGLTTQYLYDRHDVIQEIGGSAVSATYLRSLNIDEPFARYGTGATASAEYYHADGLGSVLVLTSAAGAVQTIYTYDSFGNTSVSGSSSANPFQFTGRDNDGTGLYYYRARYYNPRLHRFLSEDLLEFAGGDLNLYSYAFNNPIIYSDPSGEVSLIFIGCAGGALTNLALDIIAGRKTDSLLSNAASGCIEGAIGVGGLKALNVFKVAKGGIQTTAHGAARIAARGFTEADIAVTKAAGRTLTQADGAKVFVHEVSPGSFNVIVEGERGIVTAMKNLDQRATNNLSKNYRWK